MKKEQFYEQSQHAKKTRQYYKESKQGKATRQPYEESQVGKATRQSYEKSQQEKKRKHLSEQSEHVKQTRKSYEQSDHGKNTRKSYAESEQGKQRKSISEQSQHVNRQGNPMNNLSMEEKKGNYTNIKKTLSEKEIDTGFNYICCSCNEFKSKSSCVNTLLIGGKENWFTEDEETNYLLKDETHNLSLDGNFYVCMSCLNQIKQKKKNQME